MDTSLSTDCVQTRKKKGGKVEEKTRGRKKKKKDRKKREKGEKNTEC